MSTPVLKCVTDPQYAVSKFAQSKYTCVFVYVDVCELCHSGL